MYIYIHTYTRSYTHEQLFEATTRFKLTIKVTESSYLFVAVVFSQLLFALSLNAVLQFSFIAALCCARLFALRTLRMTVFL